VTCATADATIVRPVAGVVNQERDYLTGISNFVPTRPPECHASHNNRAMLFATVNNVAHYLDILDSACGLLEYIRPISGLKSLPVFGTTHPGA
jgi:hypothetical protein